MINIMSVEKTPLIEDMSEYKEVFWQNPNYNREAELNIEVDIDDAEARLVRFAPFIKKVFPQVKDGIIESPLTEICGMKEALSSGGVKAAGLQPVNVKGRLFLKEDSCLPISGSVKARGGIYEVLKLAESIAVARGLLSYEDDYAKLAKEQFRQLFSQYKVAVGSTGNLGLSIGIISAAIGFQVTVHMSADARQWKKDMLRSKGVKVVEYPDDYEAAVAQGRREAEQDPVCHFVDDENSPDLFAGYSVAGKRLKNQLEDENITIDEKHRLYVYLPCGVGGAPGGVTYGIKKYFEENAYCFFAEPTHAPCMTLGLSTGLHNKIAVGDIGIDGKTEADGLAVGRPSAFVSGFMKSLLSGCYTVNDEKLYPYLAILKDREGIFIEPSACAAFEGLKYICGVKHHLNEEGSTTASGEWCSGEIADKPTFIPPDESSIHIIWATGGDMVPEAEKRAYYEKGNTKMKGEERHGQGLLEAHIDKTLKENNEDQRDTVNGMMKSEKVECSFEDKTITFGFPVQQWQVNRVGNMHGGIICTAFDLTLAALARFYARENFAPTISLDVKYVRPVKVGDTMLVTAKATSTGRRITQLTCEAYSKETGKLVATGASVYMNVDTSKV